MSTILTPYGHTGGIRTQPRIILSFQLCCRFQAVDRSKVETVFVEILDQIDQKQHRNQPDIDFAQNPGLFLGAKLGAPVPLVEIIVVILLR